MLPAVALEGLGAEALTPELMQLAELATESEGGGLYIPLKSSWLEGFEYEPQSGELTMHMKSGNSYNYPGTSIATAIGFAKAPSPGSYYDENIKLGGSKGRSAPIAAPGRMFRIHGV
jgi:hypothetical protein